MALATTNGMSVDGLDAAPNGPGLAQQLGNQVDEFYGKSVANAAALPASGKYPGQRVWLVDVKGWGVWNGSAWVADTAWSTPTLNNDWVSFGSPYPVPQVRRKDGWVVFKGMMKSGTLATTVLALGPGFRPLETQRFDVPASGGIAAIDITSAGILTVAAYKASGDGSAVSLSPIRFLAEQ